MAQQATTVRRTVTLEIELDVDVPDGITLSQDAKDDIEAWIDQNLLAAADGRDITTRDGSTLRVDGHSVVVTPGPWPFR